MHLRAKFPNFDTQSPLQKIILIEAIALADFLSQNTEYDSEICATFIDLITFNPKLRYIEIWDTPLIKAGKGLLFLSPALISNGNPVRAAENFISEWNAPLFDKRGKVLEQDLFEYLLNIPKLKVQQNVKFISNESQEIECDLVIWWEKTLILIEVKCRKSIYYPYDAFQAKQQIQKAIDQLVTRKAAILNNWATFSNAACDLLLPEEVANDIKLIAVTNNPHFTGWHVNDVIVTDIFCLKRYFSKNEIEAFVEGEAIATVGHIRSSEKPTVKDLVSYLKNPPQVQVVRNGLKIDPLLIPVVKETDPTIYSFHMSYSPESYDLGVTRKKLTSASDKKVRRNDPCPCGSGLKYKKCCASKK